MSWTHSPLFLFRFWDIGWDTRMSVLYRYYLHSSNQWESCVWNRLDKWGGEGIIELIEEWKCKTQIGYDAVKAIFRDSELVGHLEKMVTNVSIVDLYVDSGQRLLLWWSFQHYSWCRSAQAVFNLTTEMDPWTMMYPSQRAPWCSGGKDEHS